MNSYFNYLYIVFLKKISGKINRLKFPILFLNLLDKYIEKYVQKKLSPYFIKSFNIVKKKYVDNESYNSGIIWLFWWQGIKDMPSIVHLCIKSIENHSNGHKVILIDKNNVQNYTDIPNYIYDKLFSGKITLTHFSDILRFNLLKNYGGLWIDSTVYCSSNLKQKYFNNLYTSGGYKNTFPKFVNGRWTGFLIGGSKNNPLFKFMDNYFQLYWKNNDYQIDYFLIDQGLYYAYNSNIGNFQNYVDESANNNNPHLFDLVDKLNDYYNNCFYSDITNDTNLFKLTYKKKYNLNNNDTFLMKLMNEYF